MKRIFIPWKLFRQTLVLRAHKDLESWLNLWRFDDSGAILLSGMSLNEQASHAGSETGPSAARVELKGGPAPEAKAVAKLPTPTEIARGVKASLHEL